VSMNRANQKGLGANRKMSHIAGEEAELTESVGAAETQRRPQNGRRNSLGARGARRVPRAVSA
jgi:hypothetical protein